MEQGAGTIRWDGAMRMTNGTGLLSSPSLLCFHGDISQRTEVSRKG